MPKVPLQDRAASQPPSLVGYTPRMLMRHVDQGDIFL